MKTHTQFIDTIHSYLRKYEWNKLSIAIALYEFEKTHGKKAVWSMQHFIAYFQKQGKDDIIATTLGHDLNGCRNKLMCPRTSSY